MARTAKVYLVGAGPEDPDLLIRESNEQGQREKDQAGFSCYLRLAASARIHARLKNGRPVFFARAGAGNESLSRRQNGGAREQLHLETLPGEVVRYRASICQVRFGGVLA